jgi:hypothetical protein
MHTIIERHYEFVRHQMDELSQFCDEISADLKRMLDEMRRGSGPRSGSGPLQ